MEKYRKDCESLMHTFPEQFAKVNFFFKLDFN